MIDILNAGGWSMWVLFLTSIIALAFIIERAIALRPRKIIPSGLMDDTLGGYQTLVSSSERLNEMERGSPLGQILAAGLRNVHSTRIVMQEAIEEAGRRVARQLERYLSAIATIASVSPLLGLMGTIIGLIEIFGSQSGAGGGNNPQQLAHGIAIALYNTCFGLIIAIPCLIFYRFYRARADRLIFEMEQMAIKLVEVVHGQRRN